VTIICMLIAWGAAINPRPDAGDNAIGLSATEACGNRRLRWWKERLSAPNIWNAEWRPVCFYGSSGPRRAAPRERGPDHES
jgi:hypothetical protein